ncbi:class I SAM-dependent methyltransferase [Evansella vedderi]|nr:class I SAM-dependent methyltransferase [Evansella vedderi]
MRKIKVEEFDRRVDFFDQMAQSSWLSKLHDELIQKTGSWATKYVLDVGCGTGRLLLKGADSSTAITGIDLSKEMVKRAKENVRTTPFQKVPIFLEGDAEKLPFQENQFDIVLSTCVVFLLPEPSKALKEMYRVLKYGGSLVLLNPSKHLTEKYAEELSKQWGLEGMEKETLLQWGRISEKRHQYTEETMNQLLIECHFTPIEHTFSLEQIALLTFATKKS